MTETSGIQVPADGAEREKWINGLMARGISRDRALVELVEIENWLVYLRQPKIKRQLRCLPTPGRRPVVPSKRNRRPIPDDVVAALRADAGGRCVYCREEFVDVRNHPLQMTVDHIVAAVVGGTDEVDNLTAACRRCNSSKHTMPAAEFIARRAPT